MQEQRKGLLCSDLGRESLQSPAVYIVAMALLTIQVTTCYQKFAPFVTNQDEVPISEHSPVGTR